MIQMKKHSSYEIPPDKPYFVAIGSKLQGVLPGKHIELRSKCIDQLDKWHSLLGFHTKYDDLQQTILGDIKTF